MNKLVKTVSNEELIPEFLQALNGILRLTDRELELMATLIKMDMEYVKEPNTNKNVANRYNRKYIIENLGITKDNLSRYIKSFKEKGILIAGPAEDELSVNKALIPVVRDRNTHDLRETISQSHSQSTRHEFTWFHGRFTPFTIIGDSHKSTSTRCLSCSLSISP